MARQLIRIVRCCFKQLKAEQNMDGMGGIGGGRGGAQRETKWSRAVGRKLHGKLERLHFSLRFTMLFPQFKTLLMWIRRRAEQTQL